MCVDSVGDVSPSETVAASQSKDEKHVDTNMEVDGNNDCCKNENDPEDLDSTPLNISVEMAESSGSEKEDGVTSSGSTPVSFLLLYTFLPLINCCLHCTIYGTPISFYCLNIGAKFQNLLILT